MRTPRSYLASIVVIAITCLIAFGPIVGCKSDKTETASTPTVQEIESEFFYGINVDSLEVTSVEIKPNEFLADIMLSHNIDYNTIHQITEYADGVFDFRRMRAGQRYHILHDGDSSSMPQYFIYDKSTFEFIVCDIRNSICVYQGKKPIRVERKVASGIIDHSLYLTLDELQVQKGFAR